MVSIYVNSADLCYPWLLLALQPILHNSNIPLSLLAMEKDAVASLIGEHLKVNNVQKISTMASALKVTEQLLQLYP